MMPAYTNTTAPISSSSPSSSSSSTFSVCHHAVELTNASPCTSSSTHCSSMPGAGVPQHQNPCSLAVFPVPVRGGQHVVPDDPHEQRETAPVLHEKGVVVNLISPPTQRPTETPLSLDSTKCTATDHRSGGEAPGASFVSSAVSQRSNASPLTPSAPSVPPSPHSGTSLKLSTLTRCHHHQHHTQDPVEDDRYAQDALHKVPSGSVLLKVNSGSSSSCSSSRASSRTPRDHCCAHHTRNCHGHSQLGVGPLRPRRAALITAPVDAASTDPGAALPVSRHGPEPPSQPTHSQRRRGPPQAIKPSPAALDPIQTDERGGHTSLPRYKAAQLHLTPIHTTGNPVGVDVGGGPSVETDQHPSPVSPVKPLGTPVASFEGGKAEEKDDKEAEAVPRTSGAALFKPEIEWGLLSPFFPAPHCCSSCRASSPLPLALASFGPPHPSGTAVDKEAADVGVAVLSPLVQPATKKSNSTSGAVDSDVVAYGGSTTGSPWPAAAEAAQVQVQVLGLLFVALLKDEDEARDVLRREELKGRDRLARQLKFLQVHHDNVALRNQMLQNYFTLFAHTVARRFPVAPPKPRDLSFVNGLVQVGEYKIRRALERLSAATINNNNNNKSQTNTTSSRRGIHTGPPQGDPHEGSPSSSYRTRTTTTTIPSSTAASSAATVAAMMMDLPAAPGRRHHREPGSVRSSRGHHRHPQHQYQHQHRTSFHHPSGEFQQPQQQQQQHHVSPAGLGGAGAGG